MLSGGEMLTEPAALCTGWRYPSFEQSEPGENTLNVHNIQYFLCRIIEFKKTILCSCTYLQQEFDSELKVVQVPWTAPKEETT